MNKSNTPQTIHLNARNYQTHTNVVTDGFYTRLRDDRTKDNGWKLTAQLSDFSDETNSTVLTNSGIALKMENMKIESIKIEILHKRVLIKIQQEHLQLLARMKR